MGRQGCSQKFTKGAAQGKSQGVALQAEQNSVLPDSFTQIYKRQEEDKNQEGDKTQEGDKSQDGDKNLNEIQIKNYIKIKKETKKIPQHFRTKK